MSFDERNEYYNRLFTYGEQREYDETPSFAINEELLKYACIKGADTGFAEKLFIIGGILVLFVIICSIALIYTAFKMTYSERIKEFRNAFIYRNG